MAEAGLPISFLITRSAGLPGTLLQAVRVANLRADHLHQYTAVFDSNGNGLVNMDNEFAAMRSLRTAFIAMLEQYPSTLAEDTLRLQQYADSGSAAA